MKKLPYRKVRIFKIQNRKGYASICCNHLTEGRTPDQAYARMIKALRRKGFALDFLDSLRIKKLITDL